MIINFVGNFQSGYVGEVADETHLAREMEKAGHIVRRIPRDEWREHVISGKPYPNVPKDLLADINLITKWHHFYDGSFTNTLKQKSGAPVLYWVWDYMRGEEWHMAAVAAADLYLGNDVRNPIYKDFKNCYYFPFDVCDGSLPTHFKSLGEADFKYDVVFTGSYLNEGNRVSWLKFINSYKPIKIFSWNYEEWIKEGFDASPAVYGEEYNKVISDAKIVLGFSVFPDAWGYWSNRVGKVIQVGGFLLQEYAPGMELFLPEEVEYFSSPQEAIEKIEYYLSTLATLNSRRNRLADNYKGMFTSKNRVKQLMVLCERFIRKERAWQT